MYLIPAADETDILQAMEDLWDTVGEPITVVKEPSMVITSMTGTFVPGFGLEGNTQNTTPVPESRSFPSMSVEKNGDKIVNIITTKVDPEQPILLKVKQDCRDYILDGRKNLHVIHTGRKYNIVSEEETASMLSRTYFVFRIELVK